MHNFSFPGTPEALADPTSPLPLSVPRGGAQTGMSRVHHGSSRLEEVMANSPCQLLLADG